MEQHLYLISSRVIVKTPETYAVMNTTVVEAQRGLDIPSPAILGQLSTTIGLAVLLSATLGIAIFRRSRPILHDRSPAFVTDTLPFLGAFGYITRHWYATISRFP
jgi:hypothetical protein